MEYVFDWDPRKATTNLRKHGVAFEDTSTMFLDERAVSIPDEEHSDDGDERWVTIGLDAWGCLLVAVHTFLEIDGARCHVRLISARKATKKEAGQYNEAQR